MSSSPQMVGQEHLTRYCNIGVFSVHWLVFVNLAVCNTTLMFLEIGANKKIVCK